jgi:hypothetical protein
MAKDITVALKLDTNQFDRGIGRAKTQVAGFGGEASKAAGALKGLFAAAAGGFLIKGAVDTTRQLEELRGAFTTVTGDAAKSASEFERVRGIANALGADAGALAETYVKLAGAGITPTNDLLTAFVDMSKNATDQLGALTAVTDLFSRTTAGGLGLEELNRLQDRGINAFGILQEELGLSRTQLSEFGKTADGANKIQAALYAGFEKRFGGTAVRELGSINSQLAIFGNITKEVQESFGRELVDSIGKGVGGMSNLREGANAAASALGQALGGAISFLIDNINIIIPVISAFAAAWAAVKLFQLAQGIMAMVTALKALTMAMLKNPFTLLAVAAAALIAFIVDLSIKTGGLGNAFKTMANFGIDAINMLYGAWSGFSTFISELMPHIGRAIYNGLNPFSDETFSDTIASGYRDAMDKARAAASSSKLIDFQFRLTPVAPTGAPAASTTGGGFQSTGGGAPAGETPAEARARANAAKARQDLLDDLSNQILLLRDQYKLETDLIGLGPIRTEQLTKQQQLKEKEAADIQKVREIEGLSAADREAAIARVKELYSTLRSETDSTVSSLVTARQAFEQQGALGQIAIDAELAQREFDQLKQLNSVFNEDLKNILGERFEIENAFYAASEAAKLQFADVNSQEAQDAIAAINAQRDAVLAAFDALSPERLQFAEQQDSFSEGWSQAFGRFREQVTNQADYATRIFDTMSQGFTDSILNFVQTGKLSFKDLFKSLMTEIIKMQANKLFIALFDKGGFFGNLFAGLFNNGGRIPAGKFGIAGERGPEIITGPANVISTNDTAAMMGGGRGSTTINYNINAVDAMSFKQMVARDPEFIYSVTQLGARRLPR